MGSFTEKNVAINTDFQSKDAALDFIAQRASEIGLTTDAKKLKESFLEREALGPTGVGGGIALPHAKSDAAVQEGVILCRNTTPIPWETFDDQPVSLIVALIVPKTDPNNLHIEMISGISRKLMNQSFKDSLFAAKDEKEIKELLEGTLS